MSKIETVQALSDSGPQLQIVESVAMLQQVLTRLQETLLQLPDSAAQEITEILKPLTERLRQELSQASETIAGQISGAMPLLASFETQQRQHTESLQQAVSLMREDLSRLPDAVAMAVTGAMEPLTTLQAEVQEAIRQYHEILALQRRTWDEITREALELARRQTAITATEIKNEVAGVLLRLENLPQSLVMITKEATKEAKNTTTHLVGTADRVEKRLETLSTYRNKRAIWTGCIGLMVGICLTIGGVIWTGTVDLSGHQYRRRDSAYRAAWTLLYNNTKGARNKEFLDRVLKTARSEESAK